MHPPPKVGGHAGSRQVGLEREVSTYKYAGDGSCYQNMQTFQKVHTGQATAGKVRQYHCSILSKQRGGDKRSQSLHDNMAIF